jgi:RND family efflux transporter MFP subunit
MSSKFLIQTKKIRLYYSKHFILKIILILFFVFILSYVILLKLITSSSRDEYMIVTSKPTILAISATGKVRPAEVINVQSTIPGVLIKILKKEGDFARVGETLAIIDNTQSQEIIKQAEADLTSAKLHLTEKEKEFLRSKKLYKRKIISGVKFEQIETAYKHLKQNVFKLESSLNAVIKKNKEYSIYSPFDAVITKRLVDTGQVIDIQKFIFEIMDLRKLEVEVDIDEFFLDNLAIGQKVFLKTNNTNFIIFSGKISFISPIVDKNTGSISVRIIFSTPTHLKPGQSINTSIIVAEFEKAISIPRSAIIKQNGKNYVKLLANGRNSELQEINFIDWPDQKVIITKGLNEGDKFFVGKDSFYKEIDNLEEF